MTLCLAAFAQLAFAEGDTERAALLAGVAEGLRPRAGFSTWPTVRRSEAELTAQVRQTLGYDRFDRMFAAGSRLSQQEAVASIRDWPGSRAQPARATGGPDLLLSDCSPARPSRKAGLMRKHDRLHAVAEVELLQNVRDERFDSGALGGAGRDTWANFWITRLVIVGERSASP